LITKDPPGARALRSAPESAPPGPALLLLTEEDLHPESLALEEAEIRGVIACTSVEDRSPIAIADNVAAFTAGALADGLERTKRYLGVEGDIVGTLSEDAIAGAARKLGVSRVLTAFAPVGPVADRIAAVRPKLATHGVELIEIRRPEDTAIWPKSTKGFFGLKERIPDLVRDLGIGSPALDQVEPFGAA
jgi:deoxyribodipyrimidine photo-lyase